MRLSMFLLVAATLLIAAEISLSQKDGKKRCSAAGHIRMESSSEQQVDQDLCATARITSVQVCEDGEWKAICGEKSTDANIKVLCKANGYSTIGANISVLSQVMGSAISIFVLNCNGSEAKPDDCLLERQNPAFTNYCRRTIIQCFVAYPDPQLCNIFFPTTTPEHTITASNSTTVVTSVTPPLASTTSTKLEAPTDLGLVRHVTAAEASHENISSITDMPTIGVVIAILLMVVVLVCLASLLMVCFVVRRRKEASQKSQIERPKQEQKDQQTLDNASQHAVIIESKQKNQRQGKKHVYQYTNNNAYGSRPMQNGNFNQWPSNVRPGGDQQQDMEPVYSDQQQDMEPIYETIPDPILKSHTTV